MLAGFLVGQVDVGGISVNVIAGGNTTYCFVEFGATIAAANDDGCVEVLTKWLQAVVAECLKVAHDAEIWVVVDTLLCCLAASQEL